MQKFNHIVECHLIKLAKTIGGASWIIEYMRPKEDMSILSSLLLVLIGLQWWF